MNHEIYEEWISAYAFGVLPPEERKALEEHLRTQCDVCKRLLHDFQEVTDNLFYIPQPLSPSSEVKDRLLAKIREKRQQQAVQGWGGLKFWWPLPWAAGFAALLLVIWTGSLFLRPRQALAGTQIVLLKGDVKINGKPAPASGPVPAGAKISTQPGGELVLRFAQDAIFDMRENSELVLSKSKGPVEVQLKKGWLLSMVHPGSQYAVKTPLALVSAKGTVFFTKVDSPDSAYVCICEGKLALSAKGFQNEIESQHHHPVTLRKQNGKILMASAPLAYHDDDDYETLEDNFR